VNVIFVVFDTLRYDHLGCNGNDWIRTPNLDRFAAEATVFDNSYCASYPTIPHRTDVITGRYGDPFHPWLPLRFDAVTLPRVLAESGHATQLLCDTPHLVNGGHAFDLPFHAWHFVRGNEVDCHWLDDRTCELPARQRELYVRGGRLFPHTMQYIRNNRDRRREEEWPSPRLFRTACRWLESNSRRDNAFLWIDCFDPHEPWDPPQHYVKMYADDDGAADDLGIRFGWEGPQMKDLSPEQVKRMAAHYAGQVTMADAWFGRMLETLDTLGMADRTAVIVTSDHGTNLGEHGQMHKGYPLWETVAHTVLMARVPGSPGARRDEIVQPQDIFPTVCQLTGTPIPESVQGHGFADLLGNSDPRPWPREVAVSSCSLAAMRERAQLTVQDAEWCLIDSSDPAERHLFHKPTDRGQEDNCLDKHPEEARRLRELLLQELKTRGAPASFIDHLATGKRDPDAGPFQPRDPYLRAYEPYFKHILPEERER